MSSAISQRPCAGSAHTYARSSGAQRTSTRTRRGSTRADFADVAKQHSKCPSGKSGGDLGTFGPGAMVKEFDEVVFSAPVNEVQGPVKTQFGYHLLEVTSRS